MGTEQVKLAAAAIYYLVSQRGHLISPWLLPALHIPLMSDPRRLPQVFCSGTFSYREFPSHLTEIPRKLAKQKGQILHMPPQDTQELLAVIYVTCVLRRHSGLPSVSLYLSGCFSLMGSQMWEMYSISVFPQHPK